MKRLFRPLILTVTPAAVLLTASCGKKPVTAPSPSPPAMEAALRSWQPADKFLRQTLAREHFLSAVPVWQDDHARKIMDLAHRYNVLLDQWTDGQLSLQTLTDEESEKKAGQMMEILDRLTEAFNQTGKLIPEGAKVLQAWEARHWNGYLLPQDFFHDALPPHESPPASTLQEKAAADFRARRAAMALPLIEALQKVSPKPGEEEKKKAPAPGPEALPGPLPPNPGTEDTSPPWKPITTPASALGLPELTARNRDAMYALRNQCEESARLYAQWAAKNWEGYKMEGPPPAGAP